jgi:1-acyl-sn-glycerol-3-phosphate acyltransferase
LSETSHSTENAAATRVHGKQRRSTSQASPLLPPWGIEIMRRVVRPGSRLLWKMDFHGLRHIPPMTGGGLVIASNHQTYFDPFWISIPIKRPTRYLAWNEALKWRLLGRTLEFLGACPIKHEPGDPAAIRLTMQWLREGGALLIFPEGARARADGEMGKFKPGAARIALEANVPILPVTIRGAHRVWPRGGRVPHLGKVEITYHPLQTVALRDGEDVRACARRVSLDLSKTIGEALHAQGSLDKD